MVLKLSLLFLIAVLWRLGGWDKARWSGYRDILIPVALFLYYSITINPLIGFLIGGLTNTIRIGYGAYSPETDSKPSLLAKFTKDREGSIIRGIYGFITALTIGIIPAMVHHKVVSLLLIYVTINVILEVYLNKTKANVWKTELSIGATKALVLFLL